MAKVYKVEFYISDYNDEIRNLDNLKRILTRLGDDLWFRTKVSDMKESEYFEFDDGLKINKTNATAEDFEEYLKKD